MRLHPFARAAACAFVVAIAPAQALAQNKATLKPEDYGKWENLGSATLAPDGRWMAYSITRTSDENELRIREVAGDSAIVVPFGTQVAFSNDSRWAAYTVGHSEKERKAMEKANKPVHSRLALMDLKSRAVTYVDDISSFAFSANARWIVMRGYTIRDRKSKGIDIVVRDLATGRGTNFGNVSEYAWQDGGPLLALAIDAEGRTGNGIQLYDPATGVLRTLESDTAVYTGLSWRKKSDDLAALKVREDPDFDGDTHVVLAWKGLAGKAPVKKTLDPAKAAGFPDDTRIVDYRDLAWADDGGTVFFGLREWEQKSDDAKVAAKDSAAAKDSTAKAASPKKADDAEEEKPGVEVWHAGDVEIMPEQKVRANFDQRRNWLAAWHLGNDRFVQLADDVVENATLSRNERIAIGTDETPYDRERMFGPSYMDVYVVDPATGARTKAEEKIQFNYGPSPAGKYQVYLKDDQYFVYDIAKKTHTNITKDVRTSFVDVDDDHTVSQKPPFGVAGWTPGDRTVLLYDRYDVWEVTPDGAKAERLTNGAEDQVRHRIFRLDYDEDYVDLSKGAYTSLYGERTKKFGFGRITAGKNPERLVFVDRSVTRLLKADSADVYAYRVEDFDDSPDYLVGGPALAGAKQVTDTNPFQKDYAWGHGELVDFRNRQGRDLQGALFYPANYEPGKKYPMIVYIYEITSNTLHGYVEPSERSAYNPTVWTQDGYFVFRPDIVYRDREPGMSAVDALVPAVEKVVSMGMVDKAKVGLVGHSWGGYQTAFVPTQTNTFAAAVAGAPLTEMMTMYLSIYWNSGGTDARIFEISQGRMEVPPWEDVEAYMRNSPVFNIMKLETPMLVTFGDKDGAVDWHQGIVMYNAARRENKKLVMLVYEGENHGLAKRPNQIDYHRRINQWFAHYLKGEPAPDWITKGVPFLQKDRKKTVTTTDGGSGGR